MRWYHHVDVSQTRTATGRPSSPGFRLSGFPGFPVFRWGFLALWLFAAILTGCESTDYAAVGNIEPVHPSVLELVDRDTPLFKLDDSFAKAVGVTWDPMRRAALVSDVQQDVVYIWLTNLASRVFTEQGGQARPYISPGPGDHQAHRQRGGDKGPAGLAMNYSDQLVACQHGERRVARWNVTDRKWITLADSYDGKRLNSPHDVAIAPNGDIYFTDPILGLEYGSADPKRELEHEGVYLLRGGEEGGELVLLTSDLERPTGIAVGLGGTTLYVANGHPSRPVYMKYPINGDGTLGEGEVFFDASRRYEIARQGLPAGMAVDKAGHVWACGPGGVLILSPTGELLGVINTTRVAGDCAFGGEDGSKLFIAAGEYLLSIETEATGIGFIE